MTDTKKEMGGLAEGALTNAKCACGVVRKAREIGWDLDVPSGKATCPQCANEEKVRIVRARKKEAEAKLVAAAEERRKRNGL